MASKRLRKKLHRGEFKELGFSLSFRFSSELTKEERNTLLNDFIQQAIEANGLVFGGGGAGNTWDGFVTLDALRGSTSEVQREKVIEWLDRNPRIMEYRASPLCDAWRQLKIGT